MTAADQPNSFAEVKTRLDEIVEAVNDDNLPLDDALALYEEAVNLGLRASDLLEADIDATAEAADSEQASESVQADGSAGAKGKGVSPSASSTAGNSSKETQA